MPTQHASEDQVEFFDLTGKDRLIDVLTYLETLKVEKATDIRVSVHQVVVLLKPLSTYQLSEIYIMFSAKLLEQTICPT